MINYANTSLMYGHHNAGEAAWQKESVAHSTELNNCTGITEWGKLEKREGNSCHKKSSLLVLAQLSKLNLWHLCQLLLVATDRQ